MPGALGRPLATAGGMLHYTLHARRGLWLFHTWEEARALWDRLVVVAPIHHLCLMPDHVHLLAPRVPLAGLHGVMSGHTRWLAHRWGWRGLRLWHPAEPPILLTNPEQLERARRTVLLEPCRGALVDDPLGWAFSTHRDATGLAWPRVRPRAPDPHEFHARVSRGGAAHLHASDLPVRGLSDASPSFEEVLWALSAVSRTPVPRLLTKGGPRRSLIRCQRLLTDQSARALARRLGVHHSAVLSVRIDDDPLAHIVDQVIGDPRFAPLHCEDLRATMMWQRYRAYLAAERRRRWDSL